MFDMAAYLIGFLFAFVIGLIGGLIVGVIFQDWLVSGFTFLFLFGLSIDVLFRPTHREK